MKKSFQLQKQNTKLFDRLFKLSTGMVLAPPWGGWGVKA
jgi:hypothetical protein